ncbi:MAG: T4 RnlA family RNA ligase [Chitinophagales bacterium]|nr:T4 RnlA family RNA ligase [Chitinophagales bacterium]
MKLLVQDFLETKNITDLYKERGVEISYSKCRRFFSLNYNQIKSANDDVLAQQCRGVILSFKDGNVDIGKTIIHAVPFFRFFNEGQGCADSVNYNDKNLKIYEKLDGSLIIVWFNSFINQWSVGTRSTPEADIVMDDGVHTFRKLFERALKDTVNLSFEEYSSTLNKDYTYMFELTTPLNRIVVKYDNYRVTLLGARNKVNLKEIDLDKIENIVPKVKTFNLSKLDEIITFVAGLNPTEQEGVVVCDSNFNRVKIKNPEYILANRARDNFAKSDRACLGLILAKKEDDVMALLPDDIRGKIINLKTKVSVFLDAFIKDYDSVVSSIVFTDDQKLNRKLFAQVVINKRWKDPYFAIFGGKAADVYDYIEKSKDHNGFFGDAFLDKILELL